MNTIELAKQFVPTLDEVYKNASCTAVLDGAADLARQGANANELIIPKMTMQGLADYDRNGGYVAGDINLTNETVQCNFDRGRSFTVDTLDDIETAGIAFGRLAAEFIRTQVVPELDAFRFAKYAATDNIKKATEATLSTGDAAIKAIRTGATALDESEVAMDQRYLFITPTLYGLIQDLETYKSKAVMDGFAQVIPVPQNRFYTAIDQKTGKTGQEAGGFAKASAGKAINFMIIHKSAVIQFEKHVAPKIITPEMNQKADAYIFGYRNVGIADVYENKTAGIYLHNQAS